MSRKEGILARLDDLERSRMERIDRYGVSAEEDLPDDAEGKSITAEWNALVAELGAIDG